MKEQPTKPATHFKVERKYHFYAAHRNQKLLDKCKNLHGHTYYVTITLLLAQSEETGCTMLFGDIDKKIEPVIKMLDHGLLMDKNDPLLKYLQDYEKDYEKLKMTVLDDVTSVENLCVFVADLIKTKAGLEIFEISIQETTSAIVSHMPNHLQ